MGFKDLEVNQERLLCVKPCTSIWKQKSIESWLEHFGV